MRLLYRTENLAQHVLDMTQNLVVGETQHPKTKTFQKFLPKRIFLGSVLMNFAVYLDNQVGLVAEKVHDETVNRVLATKFQA